MKEAAPAKINLTLKVGPPRADGRHPLDSLVMFAEHAADTLALDCGDRPAGMNLAVDGRFAADLSHGDDNLVLRAARLLAQTSGRPDASARIRLDKHLPVASGIGGGSADAAATLRALNRAWETGLDRDGLAALAGVLGADVPACVVARAGRMSGAGEAFVDFAGMGRPPPPPIFAVLAHPGRPCPTGPVYQAFDRMAQPARETDTGWPDDLTSFDAIVAFARSAGNDLDAAARSLVPEIGDVLARLSALPGARHSAMSGSGATCYALFETMDAARAGEAGLAGAPGIAWTAATALV